MTVIDSVIPEADDIPDYDAYLDMEVLSPQNGEHMMAARVIGLSNDSDGQEKGRYDPYSLKNSQVYDVMFPDGAV